MNKEELQYYKNNNKPIKVTLKNNFRYSGIIIELLENSFRFKDRFEGVITIPYEEIRLLAENTGGSIKWHKKIKNKNGVFATNVLDVELKLNSQLVQTLIMINGKDLPMAFTQLAEMKIMVREGCVGVAKVKLRETKIKMGYNIFDELGYLSDDELKEIINFCNSLIKEREQEEKNEI